VSDAETDSVRLLVWTRE